MRRGRQELPGHREDEELRQGPGEHQEPWLPEQEEGNPEDAGRQEHREDGERQELPEHQEDAGLQERRDGEGHRRQRDAERRVRPEPEGHPRCQPSHKPSHGRQEAAAG